jgi:hypothetical protein
MSSPLPSTPALLDSETGHFSFYLWQGAIISIWLNQGTGDAVRRLAVVAESVLKVHAEGYSAIHIVKKDTPMPSSDGRAEFATIMERHAAKIACVATVFEGGGFWASAMRGMNTGLQVLAPRPFAMRVFDSIQEISDWVPGEHWKRTRTRMHSAPLLSAITTARALSMNP